MKNVKQIFLLLSTGAQNVHYVIPDMPVVFVKSLLRKRRVKKPAYSQHLTIQGNMIERIQHIFLRNNCSRVKRNPNKLCKVVKKCVLYFLL